MADEQESLDRRLADAEQALRDERAERDAAQRRAAELSSRVDLWRSRAEERSERIRRLEAERDALSTLPGWVRARAGRMRRRGDGPAVAAEAAKPASGVTVRHPALPVVRTAVLAGEGPVRLLLTESHAIDLADGPESLADSDVVVVDAASVGREPGLMTALVDWLDLPARQPLIVVWAKGGAHQDERVGLLADAASIVLSDDPAARDRCGDRVRPLPVTFDPSLANPVGRSPRPAAEASREDLGAYVRIRDGSGSVVAVEGPEYWRVNAPGWLVSLAARGVPIMHRPGSGDGSDDPGRAAATARRWAYREHDPAVVWEELLTAAGLSVPPVRPLVAGLLVSKRPDDLPAAIAGFVAQEYPRKELVVGCHGFPASRIGDALNRVGDLPVRVLEFASSVPLGRCLNEAAEATGAAVLAKIDDDDYYGPGYLDDAVQALRYSGSRIVGKATQFTYLEEDDVTVLRRTGSEETVIEGAVTGGSLAFARSVWEEVRFPHRPRRVDALFLRGARSIGEAVYANSRWDFVYRRRASGHTWDITDGAFAADATPVWTGWQPTRSHAS